MRTIWIVLVGCGLLLVGAFFVSRLLVGDVSPPAVVAPPEVLRPADLGGPPAAPEKQLEGAAAMMGARQREIAPVTAAPSYPRMAEPDAPAEIATSPFQGNSKELDYAEELLAEPNPGLERLVSAHTVLSRCVEMEPHNERCLKDLAVAQSKLGGQIAAERLPRPATTLKAEPPHLNRPASGPR